MRFIVNLGLGIIQSLWGGFIFSKMWAWFVLPQFPSAPHLTYLQSAGLLIVWQFMLLFFGPSTQNLIDNMTADDQAEKLTIRMLVTSGFIYPVMFGVAYIWHLVIG